MIIASALFIIMTGFYGYDGGTTFGLTLIIVGLSYVVGDLGILRVSNNVVATIADIGLITVAIWLIGSMIYSGGVPFFIAFITSLVIGGGEWFFHRFVLNSVLSSKDPSPQR